jgi:hypothetical protein
MNILQGNLIFFTLEEFYQLENEKYEKQQLVY